MNNFMTIMHKRQVIIHTILYRYKDTHTNLADTGVTKKKIEKKKETDSPLCKSD